MVLLGCGDTTDAAEDAALDSSVFDVMAPDQRLMDVSVNRDGSASADTGSADAYLDGRIDGRDGSAMSDGGYDVALSDGGDDARPMDAENDAPMDAGDDAPTDAGDDARPMDAGDDVGAEVSVCAGGSGRALWRFSFLDGTGYSTVEAWSASCEYSLGDDGCRVSGEPHDDANWGPGVVFDSSRDFWRVRFSVAGQSFTRATLYIRAHADRSGIPRAQLSSPIYGSLSFAPTVPISTHRTYAVDWSDYLSPTDTPSLTAVTLRSMPIGLAVSSVELCVE